MQYADFAAWQLATLSRPEARAAARLVDAITWTGAPPRLTLPADLPRPALDGSRGANVTFRNRRREATAAAKDFARAPWRDALHGAARHLGGDPLALERPGGGGGRHADRRPPAERAGRPDRPVRQHPAAAASIWAAGRASRNCAAGCASSRWGRSPTRRCRSRSWWPSWTSSATSARAPIFQTMFVLQNLPEGRFELGDLVFEGVDFERRKALFDVSLIVPRKRRAAGRRSRIQHRPLLRGAARSGGPRPSPSCCGRRSPSPSCRSARLDLLGAAGRRELLEERNPATPEPLAATSLGEPPSWRGPRRIRMPWRSTTARVRLSYGELEEATGRLAHRAWPVPGWAPRPRWRSSPNVRSRRWSPNWRCCAPAVISCRCCPTCRRPAGVRAGRPRLRGFAVGQTAQLRLCCPMDRPDGRPGAATAPSTDRHQVVAPAQLAYAIFTSGSTGTPKAVGGTHGATLSLLRELDQICRSRRAMPLRLDLEPGFRRFDRRGARRALPRRRAFPLPGGREAEAGRYFGWLAEREIALAEMPAPFLADFARHLETDGGWSPRFLTVGTEPIAHSLLAELQRRLPSTRIFNFYGPTEATVEATCFEVGEETPRPGKTPIGRPMGNSRVYLVDGDVDLLPHGAAGELWLGGEAVTRGYLGRPALTAEKFVPDPFAAAPGARALPQGRPRPLAAVRRSRIPRPARRPAQDPRLPHRAGRDRSGAGGPPAGATKPAVAAAPGRDGQPLLAAWVAAEQGVDAGELRRFCQERLPDLPGAERLRFARRIAAHQRRQNRPPGPAASPRPTAAATGGGDQPARARAGGDFRRGPRPCRSARARRRLLPAGRPFPAGHPAGGPPARPLGGRAAAARAFPHPRSVRWPPRSPGWSPRPRRPAGPPWWRAKPASSCRPASGASFSCTSFRPARPPTTWRCSSSSQGRSIPRPWPGPSPPSSSATRSCAPATWRTARRW